MFSKLFGRKHADQPKGEIQEKLHSPKDIPQPIGQTLVINHKKDPDWVWGLKAVTRSFSDDPNLLEFRVYDVHETSSHGVVVKNYNSLEAHPDLVLYSGWLNKKTKFLDLEEHREALGKAV
jgi:hypothetical protein